MYCQIPGAAPIEPKVDELALERLKGQMELMQTAVEWKAKLDIAEVRSKRPDCGSGIRHPLKCLYLFG
jgi:hypothetical protein